ncbi:MBL fold metallo-hydrolase [Streptomyces sulfonofaciens]|uniref:MBL fold metallo-hydrolase n=1 Tax=Streptomyces sulfonofaciens TaxID=68272 RepID=A0A919L625_9ACTN|nr:MBL fold metallo-hydrolase [Streptomyces sulfonofaciens]GHH85272.1 MBL fold metallo-hydrolase [Streptomyces sulfonofaciens]
MREDTIIQAADGVHLVHGSNTNWVVVAEGDAVTLIDTGYPGDRGLLLDSLAALGHRPEAVSAVLVTHAHSDHLGSVEHLNRAHGVPVYLHEAEVPHARREFLHQVSVGQVLANAWRPRVLPWVVHAMRSGGLADVRVSSPQPFPGPGPLDLPGRPVPVLTPGHTQGHCVYHLPDAGLVVSGDALVSGHAATGQRGPQLLPVMFDKDRAEARESLRIIEKLDADTLLPGHGPLHRGSVRSAAQLAYERAS